MKKKACFVCLKNCVRLHGDEDEDPDEEITPAGSSGPAPKENGTSHEPGPKENVASEPCPSFLKKMTELSITSALQLPASFVKSFVSRIGETVTLKGPGNEKWRVQIGPGKEKFSVEFIDGWRKFAVDHVLQIGDQLSFTLTADSYFQVVVYDESGSQKISATDAINSALTLQQSKAVEVDQGGPSVQLPFRIKPTARPKQKVRRRIRTDGAVPPVKPDVKSPVVHSSESELRNSDTPEKGNKSKEIASEEKSHTEPDPDESHQLPLLPPHVLSDGHVISKRRPVSQAERDRVLLAARALPVTNPKLVVVMSRAYVYRGFWMALSRPFAKAHMPKETREVTMLNKAGRKWTVKWLYKETAGSGFSGGWRGFALDHRLEEGDVCVFEIVDPENYVILVHIFRVIGGPKEDIRDYGKTPGKSRNGDWIQTPTGFKRKLHLEAKSFLRHSPGPSSPKKCIDTPGIYKPPVRCSKPEDPDYSQCQSSQKVQMSSGSKKGPKPAAKVDHGVRSPDFVPDETLQYCQKAKKAKVSPTTSCEVYAEYASFITPTPGDAEKLGLRADLNVRPLLTKKSAEDKGKSQRDNLLKLGKELVGSQTPKSASPSSSSSPSDDRQGMQIVKLLQIDGVLTRQGKEDPNLQETCACVSENHVSP